MSLALDEERVGEFFRFDPRKEGFSHLVLGEGSVGGKARPLFLVRRLLEEGALGRGLGFSVSVPRLFAVGCGLFEELKSHPRVREAASGGDYYEVERAFEAVEFPTWFREGLVELLKDLKGPIVVRSSSLLEDSLKHSFAGKYMSVFLADSFASPEERAMAVERCARRIYARVYNPVARTYRERHGLGEDSMAILVMEASGRTRGDRYFYPTTAGVAFSRAFRLWSRRLRSEDGLLRMVFGFGTRGTSRWYARIFSLTDPFARPEGNLPELIAKYSQETFDAVDLKEGCFCSFNINQVPHFLGYHRCAPSLVSFYDVFERELLPYGKFVEGKDLCGKLVFSFRDFPRTHGRFFDGMRALLRSFEELFGMPVDCEFAYEPDEDALDLVQVRSLWSGSYGQRVEIPQGRGRAILRGDRMVSNGAVEEVPYLVFVDPEGYAEAEDKPSVARALAQVRDSLGGAPFVLVGPGRWGSTNPELGVPVRYNEIAGCVCLVELGIPRKGFWPELSYGTHFFGDLEVDGVLYMPVFVGEKGNLFDEEWFRSYPCRLGPMSCIRIYRGKFSAFFSSERNEGVVFQEG